MTTLQQHRPRGFRRTWAAILILTLLGWVACFRLGPAVVRWFWLW